MVVSNSRIFFPSQPVTLGITVNRPGRYAVAIFDPYRFVSDIIDGYAPSAKAFYQFRCCRLALSKLGCFIKR